MLKFKQNLIQGTAVSSAISNSDEIMLYGVLLLDNFWVRTEKLFGSEMQNFHWYIILSSSAQKNEVLWAYLHQSLRKKKGQTGIILAP